MNNKKNNLIDLEMFRNINIENRSIEFLKKIIFARVDEIIDLIFNKINFDDFYNKFDENILVFTGEGSKVLNANPEFSNKKFHYFNDINIYEETLDSICESYKKFNFLDNPNEITVVPKKLRKSGLFEKFFDLFR